MTAAEAAVLDWLRSPEAVRARAEALFARGQDGKLRHFVIDMDRLSAAADYVANTVRDSYPDLVVPHHARWRHFAAGNVDRWGTMAARLRGVPADEVARIRCDLVALSVLLDAGAGPAWRYEESATGLSLTRSEGLAVASLHAFQAGLFSADPQDPLRADAAALEALDETALARAFQAQDGNILAGLSGRTTLMRSLGLALRVQPDLFGAEHPRIGRLFDYLRAQVREGGLAARDILRAVLRGFAPIWPGRTVFAGENLGDVWRHPDVAPEGPAPGLVPFHKLSQWLAYSLIEVMEDAAIPVRDLGALTGLPEYRNGGLFIDMGVLIARDRDFMRRTHRVGDEAIVEWRALTVALLDRIAPLVRDRLGRTETEMPLSRVLEGGTWAAGRRIAREVRPDGQPPLRIDSDGTVF